MVGSFVVYLNSHMAPNIFFSDNPLAWHFKYHCSSCHAWFNDAITYSYLCFVSLWPSMDLPLRLHMLEFRLHIAIVFLCSTDSLNTFTEWLNPVAHARHGWPASSSCRNVAKQGVILSVHCTCHCTIVLLSVLTTVWNWLEKKSNMKPTVLTVLPILTNSKCEFGLIWKSDQNVNLLLYVCYSSCSRTAMQNSMILKFLECGFTLLTHC